jgi:hypothetical protein
MVSIDSLISPRSNPASPIRALSVDLTDSSVGDSFFCLAYLVFLDMEAAVVTGLLDFVFFITDFTSLVLAFSEVTFFSKDFGAAILVGAFTDGFYFSSEEEDEACLMTSLPTSVGVYLLKSTLGLA